MSKLKSEFMAHVYEEQGTPLRAWLLGRIGQLSGLASAFAPLSNWMLRQPLFKRALRIAPERELPKFTSSTFDRWWRNHPSKIENRKSKIVLFVDTFSRYNHPEVAIAAVKVLEQAGYEILVPPWKCCGRPLLSQGQPSAALSWVKFNLSQLAPLARQGIPILGLEPSCISALKDDYTDLLPGADSEVVAKMTTSVEEFVISHRSSFIDDAATESKMKDERSKVLLHGHCHQKALWSTQGTRQALTQVGYDVHEVDSTCCGMAGAFGYEAEHYDLSRRIGELALLPAVRAAEAEAIIVAPGTSCREQIQHFTGRKAIHPVEALAHLG
jgi:Fe-S oxidoreductase